MSNRCCRINVYNDVSSDFSGDVIENVVDDVINDVNIDVSSKVGKQNLNKDEFGITYEVRAELSIQDGNEVIA